MKTRLLHCVGVMSSGCHHTKLISQQLGGGKRKRLPSARGLFKLKVDVKSKHHNFSLDWTQMKEPDCSSMICFTCS